MKINEIFGFGQPKPEPKGLKQIKFKSPEEVEMMLAAAAPSTKRDLRILWKQAGNPMDYGSMYKLLNKAGVPDVDAVWSEFFKQRRDAEPAAEVPSAEVPATAPSAANLNVTTPPQGVVFVVKALNGETYFKSYTGDWYQKLEPMDNRFNLTHSIKDERAHNTLDKLLRPGKFKKVAVQAVPGLGNEYMAVPPQKTKGRKR